MLAWLLLLAGTSRAQTGPEAKPRTVVPPPKLVTVNVELPRTLGLLSDCARIIFSRQDDDDSKLGRVVERIRNRREKPAVNLQIEVPRNKVTKTLGIVE